MQSGLICLGKKNMSELLYIILEQQCVLFQEITACFLLNPIWDRGMCLGRKAEVEFFSKGLLFHVERLNQFDRLTHLLIIQLRVKLRVCSGFIFHTRRF